ncbi:MAG TPA: hypothetical protein VFG10_04745 [Saprospiraceae bacterium]|nr:hypothetical protein [Saprospiraceae bacterium]
MKVFYTNLDNRELALLSWMLIGILFLLFNKKTKATAIECIRILLSPVILKIFLSSITYTVTLIFILKALSFWEPGLIKETIFWFITFGLISIFKINKIVKDKAYLLNLIISFLKIFIVFEYISNFYVLPFIAEFLLLPVLLFIGSLIGYIEYFEKNKERFVPVTTLLNTIQICFGLFLISFITYNLFTNYTALLSWFNLKELLIPFILTISYLPFLYCLALYNEYESLFLRIRTFSNKDFEIIKLAKFKSLLLGNIDIARVNKITTLLSFENLSSLETAKHFFKYELKQILNKNISNGVFIKGNESFREPFNYSGDGSINSVIDYLDYHRDQIHTVFAFEEKAFNVIGFKVFTKEVVFVMTQKNILSVSYSRIQNFIDSIDWKNEYEPFKVEDILNNSIENKSLDFLFLWEVLSLEAPIKTGTCYSNKLELTLEFEDGDLVKFYDKNGLNASARHLKYINPSVVNNYYKEAEYYRNKTNKENIILEVNAQADSYSKTPEGYANQFINEFKTPQKNINFYNLLIAKYGAKTSISEFKQINYGRFKLINEKNNMTILSVNGYNFIFDAKGNYLYSSN